MRTVMEIVVEKIVNLEIFVLERLKLNVEIKVGYTVLYCSWIYHILRFKLSNFEHKLFKLTWTWKLSNFRLTNFYFFIGVKSKSNENKTVRRWPGRFNIFKTRSFLIIWNWILAKTKNFESFENKESEIFEIISKSMFTMSIIICGCRIRIN